MNKLLEIQRDLRDIPDPRARNYPFHLTFIGSRELYVQKIMATYNYDRENAEKAFEYIKFKRTQYMLGRSFSTNLIRSLHWNPCCHIR